MVFYLLNFVEFLVDFVVFDDFFGVFFVIRCLHYKRRCKIRAPCCGEVFTCRHCHNEATSSVLPLPFTLFLLLLLWIIVSRFN